MIFENQSQLNDQKYVNVISRSIGLFLKLLLQIIDT